VGSAARTIQRNDSSKLHGICCGSGSALGYTFDWLLDPDPEEAKSAHMRKKLIQKNVKK
jgi:hypothetical protein